ncbi:PfkB family carbohydrate kinase [Pseudonocardia spinosispora]|uniref:PfkB family carbohydrate kinase n=1 Tax=Pseudonocardia spinosispora TaxID=103441 RepID=UPI000425E64C|nr:PfkB family carbohydrate kinase [Pseudonocardia spinosispora]
MNRSPRGIVLCVGLTTLDVVHHVSGPPTWGRKERSVGGELVAGGPAANAAVTAAALLGRARLVTAIGDGPVTTAVHADLAEHGVEVVDLAPPGWRLPVASALVDVHTGDRTVVSPGALGNRGVEATAVVNRVLDGAGAVLVDGHHPAVAARVATLAAQANVPVLLDAGSWKDEVARLLPRIEVAACSADFTPPDGRRAGDDPYGVADHLHRRGVPTVLVTDGPRPVRWSTLDGERGGVEVPRVRPVDTLGAGDVFHGALAAAVAGGAASVHAAASFASRVAAIRCGRLGARAWLDEAELSAAATELAGLARAR